MRIRWLLSIPLPNRGEADCKTSLSLFDVDRVNSTKGETASMKGVMRCLEVHFVEKHALI